MRPSRSSATASMVSVARGIGVSSSLRDPLAHAFSGSELTRRVERFGSKAPVIDAARFAMRALSLGLVDHNTLRMLLVDRHLQGWLQQGIRQVVLLGAGLDSRAWRLEGLSECRLFEVDHPDTQAYKQRKAAGLSPRASSVAFVPHDFERGGLGQALADKGHLASEPSAWVCEGVIAYLKPAVTTELLRQVGAASAAGSQLAMSYVTPLRARRGAVSTALVALLVRQLGERAQGFVAPDTLHEWLESARLSVVEDSGWDEWTRQFSEYSPLPNLFKERLVIARKV